jgi:hypothetical protein
MNEYAFIIFARWNNVGDYIYNRLLIIEADNGREAMDKAGEYLNDNGSDLYEYQIRDVRKL